MPIASPLDLNPRAWLNPNAGTYNGSNQLTALANSGTDGGNFSITGSPAKGTAIGALQVLHIDSISKRLTLALSAIGSGTMTVVFAGKLLSTGGISGIFALDWPGGLAPSAKAFYADVGAGDTFAFGNACCDVPGHPPAMYSAAGGLSDTSFHTLHWQLGTTNGLWRDNSAQAITGGSNESSTGAMPDPGAQTWDFCYADPSSETANADVAGILVFDYVLTTQQRTDLYDWFQSQASGAISGTAAITMPAPALSAAGTVPVQGTAAITMPAPGLTSAGTVAVQGAATITMPAPGLVADGDVAIVGDAAITMPAPGLVADGVVAITGEADIVMPAPGLAAEGVVAAVPIEGVADITMPPPTLVASGIVTSPAQQSQGGYGRIRRRYPGLFADFNPAAEPPVLANASPEPLAGAAPEPIPEASPRPIRVGESLTGSYETARRKRRSEHNRRAALLLGRRW